MGKFTYPVTDLCSEYIQCVPILADELIKLNYLII